MCIRDSELTIQGMGNVVFDGNKSSRIFNVACDNVVLNGLTFINGNGSLEYGGAICWGGTVSYTHLKGQI